MSIPDTAPEFDDDAYSGQDQKVTYESIVMMHIKKISELSCKDFYGGYWMRDDEKTQYRESTREAFINAIHGLYDLTHFRLKKKEAIKEKIQNVINEYDELLKDFSENPPYNPNYVDDKLDDIAFKTREVLQMILEDLNNTKFFEGNSIVVQ